MDTVIQQPYTDNTVVYNQQLVQPVIQSQPTTTIIQINQVDINHPRGIPRDWSTPLCGCFEDCGGCVLAALFFQCYECHVSSKIGEECTMPCCTPHATMLMRASFRGKHNIQGSIMNDCCIVSFCGHCALCQLSRELDNMRAGIAAP